MSPLACLSVGCSSASSAKPVAFGVEVGVGQAVLVPLRTVALSFVNQWRATDSVAGFVGLLISRGPVKIVAPNQVNGTRGGLQMSRVDTSTVRTGRATLASLIGIVAKMVKFQPLWHWANQQHVGKAVRTGRTVAWIRPKAEAPVTLGLATLPQPATLSLVHLAPESFYPLSVSVFSHGHSMAQGHFGWL